MTEPWGIAILTTCVAILISLATAMWKIASFTGRIEAVAEMLMKRVDACDSVVTANRVERERELDEIRHRIEFNSNRITAIETKCHMEHPHP